MSTFEINGINYAKLLAGALAKLEGDVERINNLNVFPVPDGDTGSNMKMTLEGGVKKALEGDEPDIGVLAKNVARAMVLTARGNSGVILSQFFKGLAMGLETYDKVDAIKLANAFISGTNKAYSVVGNPVEGTILTVMRIAGIEALKNINESSSIDEYLECYLKHANIALQKTPDLLPVLKKAKVIDSGGAGFVLVIEGMIEALSGKTIDLSYTEAKQKTIDTSSFNADSELTYGYCTEFILQLQNKKVNTKEFDLKIITDFLEKIGNSIVAFKDDDIIKVHVHTMDPGLVLSEFRKYGEYLTVKIENMNVQHSDDSFEESQEDEQSEPKKYGILTVALGDGLKDAFKEIGVDVVLDGGQTMNTSTNEFIEGFKKINSEYIFVYPNNSNILLAANMAAEAYKDKKIIVIPTKSIAEGYSAISMLNTELEIEDIIEEENEALKAINTLEVTYSIRDTNIDEIEVKKDDFICIYDHKLIASKKNRVDSVEEAVKKLNLAEKSIITIFYGKGVDEDEIEAIKAKFTDINPMLEVYTLDGKQDIYSYIIGIE